MRAEHYQAAQGEALEPGVAHLVRVTVAALQPVQLGDKLANRHGAKGTVGRILPDDRMPVLPDGRTLDLILNPVSVPSRMNIGQLLETHLGLAAHDLGCAVETPGFGGATPADVEALLGEAGLPGSGMLRLRDGRSGRLFDQESTVGYQYVLKLVHTAQQRLRARATGDYSPETQQPMAGGGISGGPRIGIMETWALQAHGAGHVLQEMLTLKSDDVAARARTWQALCEGGPLPRPTVPHSLRRLVTQLRGLCLELRLWQADGREMDPWAADATVEVAARATLEAAPAERLRQGSLGALDPDPGSPLLPQGDRDAAPGLHHLELAAPVQHPWSRLLGAGDAGLLPPVQALPVLPATLRGGRAADPLYQAVRQASHRLRTEGATLAHTAALQQAVDQLIGDGSQPGCLTRLLYGKGGWVAAALAGKSVDYVGRAVASPGADLRLDECSLPRALARVVFEPLTAGELVRGGHASSAADACCLIRAGDPRAEAALERAVAGRLVLLHRAPVLHRWGMQAFRPRLADEPVVRLHPLSLVGFNADFDGDEVDVYLPLSAQAQREAAEMLPSRNQVGVATGHYATALTQDMVLGIYYATVRRPAGRPRRSFATGDEVALAFWRDEVGVHDTVAITGGDAAGPGAPPLTTVGRALFERLLPEPLRGSEGPGDQPALARLLLRCWGELGPDESARLADALLRLGLRIAARSGLSMGKDTLVQHPRRQERLAQAWREVETLPPAAADEKADAAVAHWLQVSRSLEMEALAGLAADRQGLNPLHLMLTSGARSNRTQVRHLLALRGLFATPDRRVLSTPCTTTLLEGHTPLEYLASTYGARKGLIDTAVKTATAGFLYKRILNAVQDVLVTEEDCGSAEGVVRRALEPASAEAVSLAERIAGRVALADLLLPGEPAPRVRAGEVIDQAAAQAIQASGLVEVPVRSPLTCRAAGVCARCYGVDSSQGRLPGVGLAAGVLAAQSLGEPMTQLTMRTFAVGVPVGKERRLGTIVGGLRRLDELFEAGRRPGRPESAERAALEEELRTGGRQAVAEGLLAQVQRIYRQQGITVDDRHLEVVLRQMLGSLRVTDPGDTALTAGEVVTAAQLVTASAAATTGARAGRPAQAEPVVLGVSEVATLTQGFLAAAVSYDGVPALARAAARRESIMLDGVRACTLLGKVVPTRRAPLTK
ncbi:MAG: hypothetical protein AB1505_20170 [Candidatus Latescibacterota bacterium]